MCESYGESKSSTDHTIASILGVYFPDSDLFGDESKQKKLKLITQLLDFFSSPPANHLIAQVKDDDGAYVLPLDFQQFQKICQIEAFYAILESKPKEALSCMSAAVHQILSSKWGSNILDAEAKINIRLHNYPESMIALKNLKAAYIDRLVSVRGTVVKVSTVKPLVIQMSFSCGKCGVSITRNFHDGKFSPPPACIMQGCKSRSFNPIRSTARPIDFQKIRVQELLKSEHHEEGRVPRTVECELTEDLVDACIPGDVVTVTGIIRVINNYMDIGGGKSKSKNQGIYYLYLEAISIKNTKSQTLPENLQDTDTKARAVEQFDLFTFSSRDLEFIVKFSEEHGSDIFRQILQSICPSIYGHELVKAGITLSLFGGVRKHSMDQNQVPVRGDIHVIIVGDPGLGKSQLLQAAAAISPRGIYVCGNATTNAGLTVAVVKDPMTSDYAFEAGAMVLADCGLCCIDEFDKMSAERQALLEAMEQQCVSVAKAGLVASLSARTSVLAAANPVGGHYNRAKTVNENLKMSAALLSRFDLVFILLDKPDELLDKRVSEHIMSFHTASGEHSTAAKKLCAALSNDRDAPRVKGGSLLSRLKLDSKKDADFVPLPGPLLRKYIAYARNFVFPRMTKAAAEILQKFYLRLRDHNTSADGTPITARQLESLVRLAEARARLDLREEITAQDASDVVEIMKESLFDKYVDEHGFVDFGRSWIIVLLRAESDMANSVVRVAAAQMTSVNDLAVNFATCSRLVKEAAAAGAKMLCFPENFSYIGAKDGESLKIAEPLDGPIMKGYCSLARESSIWLSLGGFQEKGSDDSHLHNTHVVIDDTGNIISTYSKMFLFDVDIPGGAVFKESSFTEAGKEIVAVESPFGRLGLTVCYDLRFPELYQQLRFKHEAQVLLVPAAFTKLTGAAHWEVLLRARAIENQCYVIAAAQAGKHNDNRESYGDTLIIDPWGSVIGRLLDRTSTGITVAEIDFSLLDSVRTKMPISKHRKPVELWK